MIKYIYILLTVIVMLSCAPKSSFTEEIKLEGKFVQKDQEWIELQFIDNNFIFSNSVEQTHLITDVCCDTISFGKWKMDPRGFVILNSPEKFENYDFMTVKVSERRDYSRDSIYFIINNPIEKYYSKNMSGENRDVIYKVFLGSNNNSYTLSFMDKKHLSNKFSIIKKKGVDVSGFEITVLINPEIKLTNHSVVRTKTEFYDIKDIKSNVFEINIPNLSFEFLTLRRLSEDYVKIINKNKLLWDGREYIRKK